MSEKSEKLLNEAHACMGKRNYSRAIKYFQKYLELEPDDKKALYTLGDAYAFEEAYNKATDIYLQVAEYLKSKGFTMKAIAVCKRILNISPNSQSAKILLQNLYDEKTTEEETSQVITGKMKAASPAEEERKEAQSKLNQLAYKAIAINPEEDREVEVSGMQEYEVSTGTFQKDSELAYNQTVAMPKSKISEMASRPPQKQEQELEFTDQYGSAIVYPGEGSFLTDKASSPAEKYDADTLLEVTSNDLGIEYGVPSALKEHYGFTEGDKPAVQRTATQETRILKAKDLLFDELTAEEYLEIINLMDIRTYQAGELIVKEGDPGDSMFIICSGEVSVRTRDRTGKEVELARLFEGDFFGEVSLLTGKPRTATIIAITPTELLELKSSSMPEIQSRHPRIKEVLHEFHMKRIRSTIQVLVPLDRL